MQDEMTSALTASYADSNTSYRVSIDLHETNVSGRITYCVSTQSPMYFSTLRQFRHLNYRTIHTHTHPRTHALTQLQPIHTMHAPFNYVMKVD